MADYTDEQRKEALEIALQFGPAKAAKQMGIPKPTVRNWMTRYKETADADRLTLDQNNARAAQQARVLRAWSNIAGQKEDLAVRFAEEVHQLLDTLHQPYRERHVKVIGMGQDMGQGVEIVDVDYDEPTVTAKKLIMTTAAIAIDKMQVLTGDVTSRIGIEQNDPDLRRRELAATVDELATRRALGTAGAGDAEGTSGVRKAASS